MTQLEAVFQHNPFDNTHFRRSRKVVFIIDQIARFKALDPEAFAERIIISEAIAQTVSEAMSNTGSALDQQMGATTDSNVAFANVATVVGQQFAIIQATLGKGNAGIVKIFGKHITNYTSGLTHENAVKRLPKLLKSVTTNVKIAGPVAVSAIANVVKAYTDAHGTQTTEKNTVLIHRTTADNLDPQFNIVLWQNQTATVNRYPAADHQPQRNAAANYGLLLPPAPGAHAITYADYLASGLTVDINADDPQPLPAPTTRLLLRNPGPVRLQVALSILATDFPTTGIIQEIAPGSTIKIVLGDMGDPVALPHLLVYNPTSELGQYEIVLG